MSSSSSSGSSGSAFVPSERACFDGVMLTALAYGALVMVCVQTAQVLLYRPRRDQTFYLVILYTSIVFPLTTAGFFGRLRFAELTYVVNRNYPGGLKQYSIDHSDQWASYLSKVCTTIMPWFADLLIFYRVFILYGNRCWFMILPFAVFLGRIGTSIPGLVSALHPSHPLLYTNIFNITQGATYLALNVFVTITIWLRLYHMRYNAERILGRLQASMYNSYSTLFVESGAFFTLWSMVYLMLRVTNNWAQDVFWQPYAYVVAITRMLVVLRMAQNRAWTRDIIEAAKSGIMDWRVSSTGSIELSNPHLDRIEKAETVGFRS
ncbi:hypothetical protein CPB83DRAFT_856579 [Crepidotus variabilis]|uniref:Uncharacterized protein n=1 Tax=Crepidotus variabilis TaxID=179855 RepID=A0A9P6JNJ8_9AGAR|nr:hypothetical protein CPB83DRAFT_856579 [Crepidotus variabilis]